MSHNIGTPVFAPFNESSYASLTTANAYFNTRLDTDVWDESTDIDKQKALSMATRAIDKLAFQGCKTSATQSLEFPRNGFSEIPKDIVIACCEHAYQLLDGVDIEQERKTIFTVSNGYAAVRETYDRTIAVESIRAGILSNIAWDHLKPYLVDPRVLTLCRV